MRKLKSPGQHSVRFKGQPTRTSSMVTSKLPRNHRPIKVQEIEEPSIIKLNGGDDNENLNLMSLE